MVAPLSIAADTAAQLAQLFRLLADGSRLKVLIACLHEARSVSDIAAAAGLSPSLTSHHLRLLRASRLVRARREGRKVFYAAADAHVRRVISDLIAHAAEGADGGPARSQRPRSRASSRAR